MTKSELVEKLCLELRNLSKTEVEIIVDTLFNKMVDALKKGHRVELRGFGSFEVRTREARQGRNPKTGASVYVKNRKVPFFKVGKELRDRVNGKVDTKMSTDDLPHVEQVLDTTV
jgi:integration host factor subunit beta